MDTEIDALEKQLYALTQKLNALRAQRPPTSVDNYDFQTLSGPTTLLNLFRGREVLFVIHNMGMACRYCTVWADGLNAFLPHLEDQYSVVLVSKDSPEEQRRMANDRGWRFVMASHAGSRYLEEQTVLQGPSSAYSNYPGMVCYLRDGQQIVRKNSVTFGPGDEFCSIWNVLSLAGIPNDGWTPQYRYWSRPNILDDGGENIRE